MNAQKIIIDFEKNENQTASYHQTIAFYKALAEANGMVQLNEFGMSDAGFPLHEFIIDLSGDFSPRQDKTRLFINNAIHPGEPCGVDASMMLARDICADKNIQSKLENIQIVILPFYNIGGGLNRNSHSRANQNGPESYGFRGNAKNLDLNRDFVKCDSKNGQSFNQLFSKWNPHVMIDNHTSNGADYQYTMTLIATQKDKLPVQLADFMQEEMLPFLYKDMEEKKWEMIPYVYCNGTPDGGIYGFLDYPRYSSGYASLHHTISFMPETHMLKPYKDRVWSTYEFMESMIEFLSANQKKMNHVRAESISEFNSKKEMALDWTVDSERKEKISFKGYEGKNKTSDVSGHQRLYYDRSQPFEKEIDFFNSYKSKLEVQIPDAYLIPQAYYKVIERLKWNGVELTRLEEDEVIEVNAYYITDYKTTSSPYEGHYLHSKVETRTEKLKIQFFKGDYKIVTDQIKKNYIVSTLEPSAPDSFFAWNFFDGILMQKEHFSDYVFEDLANDIIKEDQDLKSKLEEKKSQDQTFKEDAKAQLNFIYEHSHHYEPTHNRYPVFRINPTN